MCVSVGEKCKNLFSLRPISQSSHWCVPNKSKANPQNAAPGKTDKSIQKPRKDSDMLRALLYYGCYVDRSSPAVRDLLQQLQHVSCIKNADVEAEFSQNLKKQQPTAILLKHPSLGKIFR